MAQFWKPGTEKPRLVEDEEGGVLFLSGGFSSSSSSSSGYGYASIEKQRQRLPVYKYRTAILYLVETHATTIVVGETGSGKTTQIPQVYITLLFLSLSLSLCVCKLESTISNSNSNSNSFVLNWHLQFLKEAGWAAGGRLIACTQPRRLAVQVPPFVSLIYSIKYKMRSQLFCY